MTETEWVGSIDVDTMLAYVACHNAPAEGIRPPTPISFRKLRLFLVGCCRLSWDLFTADGLREVIEVAERFADGQTEEAERNQRCQIALELVQQGLFRASGAADSMEKFFAVTQIEAAGAACVASESDEELVRQEIYFGRPRDYVPIEPAVRHVRASRGLEALVTLTERVWEGADRQLKPFREQMKLTERGKQAHLLHCVAGNPFRPVVFDPNWRTETVVSLASAIYSERAFDRMPILADALEETGCDHADILTHCRGPGQHARGCWVVDGVLGKE